MLFQGLLEVGLQIREILDTNAKAHQTVVDSARRPHLGRDARVGHRGGMADQGLDAAQALGEAKKSRSAEKMPGRLATPFEPDADHASEVAHLPPSDVVVGMFREAGIVYAGDLRLLFQPDCEARASAQWRSMRTDRVLMPRSTSHASNGPGTPPAAF